MSMQFKGTVQKVEPAKTGQGKNGEWSNQQVIVKTDGQYPRNVCLLFFKKEFIDKLKVGQVCEFHIEPESREFNGKWYSDIKCWKYEVVGGTVDNNDKGMQTAPEQSDNLPF